MTVSSGSIEEFLNDIAPFFYGRSLVYVDVGAFKGEVFKKVAKSPLKLRDVHLIEPNPASLEQLRSNIEGFFTGHSLTVHPVAVGNQTGRVRLRAAQSMTRVVAKLDASELGATGSLAAQTFISESCTLDGLTSSFADEHISLLKIDVEGFEREVLGGASGLLSAQKVDVIYIEAGMNPEGSHQVYYRDIDDILLSHGYRLFRIYEQMHEWLEDSPHLRRANLAYFSSDFARKSPRKLVVELYQAQTGLVAAERERDQLKQELSALTKAAAKQKQRLVAAEQAAAAAEAAHQEQLSARLQLEKRGKKLIARADVADERARSASFDREGLLQRVAVLVQEHQRLLERFAAEQVKVDDLARRVRSETVENGRLAAVIAEKETRIKESEEAKVKISESLVASNLRFEAEHNSRMLVVGELSALQGMRDTLVADNRRLTKLLRKEQSASPRTSEAMLRQLAQLRADREKLSVKVTDLRENLAAAEAMARAMVLAFSQVLHSQRQALSEAFDAKQSETRIRHQLSYQLGSAIVLNTKSPRKIVNMPSAVVRTISRFRRNLPERMVARRAKLPVDCLGRPGHTLMFVPSRHSRTIILQSVAQACELSVTVLSVAPGASTCVHLRVIGSEAGIASASVLDSCVEIGEASSGAANFTLHCKAGERLRPFMIQPCGEDVALSFEKVSGVPCVLRLELRAPMWHSEAGAPPPAVPRPKPCEPAAANPSVEPPVVDSNRMTSNSVLPEKVALSVSSECGKARSVGKKESRTRRRLPDVAESERRYGPIWFAQKLIAGGNFDEGIAYANAKGNSLERRTIHLFHANRSLDDDSNWLRHTNAYISQFDIAPLELRQGPEPRYRRLTAARRRLLSDGPVISVIMPAFNAEDTLELSARSILNQTWGALELIIVNDLSSDATLTIAKRLADEDSRVRLLQNVVNVGPYVSKNRALQIAAGAYVTGHDADDWAHPERLEHQVKAMLADPSRRKAGVGKMLRLTEVGEFNRIGKNTPNVDDGVLQTAFISCMLDVEFMRTTLGSWDSIRFGADSELISRARMVLGDDFTIVRQLGMLCLDSACGLTNDAVHGVSRVTGLSPTRSAYRDSFGAWHRTLGGEAPFVPFPHSPRLFAAPLAMQVVSETVNQLLAGKPVPVDDSVQPEPRCSTVLGESAVGGRAGPDSSQGTSAQISSEPVTGRQEDVAGERVDVCIITNLAFVGGNTSSTLSEVRACLDAGLSVRILHCPTEMDAGRGISSRFADFHFLCTDCRSDRPSVDCALMIARHPCVIGTAQFREIVADIRANDAVFVINNSRWRPGGEPVFELADVEDGVAATNVPEGRKMICPLGPLIREEWASIQLAEGVQLADVDWPPLFNLERLPPREARPFGTPMVIGRHSRDGLEKWPKERDQILDCYPDRCDIAVHILGGARYPKKTLGRLPANWTVYGFGEREPSEFLHSLDVLVYFPHASLVEAFGRTVMEAILVGLPCVLPMSLAPTFPEMAFFCEPRQVASVLDRLRESQAWCADFVAGTRQVARAKYSSDSFVPRLRQLRLQPADSDAVPTVAAGGLDPERALRLRGYVSWVTTGDGESERYRDSVAHSGAG